MGALLTDERPAQDPLRIPYISGLIRQSKSKPFSEKNIQSNGNSLFTTTLSRLPLEVLYLILDNLDFEELEKIRIATSLPVGDQYWRGRLPRAVIFEFDNILDEGGIRWDHLVLRGEELMVFCPALLFRQRCLTRLHRVREVLCDKLANQEGGIQSPESWPDRADEASQDAKW